MIDIVLHRGNEQISLFSLTPFVTVTKAEHVQQLLSMDRINLSVSSSQPITFYLGDYMIYEGRKFTLNLNPVLKKIAENNYSYDLQLEGVQYDLLRKKYFNYDSEGNYTTGDFPLTGDIEVFLIAILNNGNRDESEYSWILGDFPISTETKTITFSNVNCLAALQSICQEFEQEFEIVQDIVNKTNTLHIRKIGTVLVYSFEYGYKNGLYSLNRDNISEGQIITRLYPYGSSENIPANYRNYSPRLKLPENYGDYIQDNAKVEEFGLVEEIKNYDDIKPTFKGVVSGIGSFIASNNTFEIFVSNMDFDLNEKKADGVSTKYLIPDTPAKIHVNKGNLAGYEFEIHKYTHATKSFEVKVFADDRGQKFPDLSTVFKFAIGDEITLLDIVLPDVYILNAENKLKDKAIEDYEKLSQNNVKYSLDIDPMYFVDLGFTEYTKILSIGDYVTVKDSALSINKQSRIISLTRDLLNLFKYSVDISDTYEISIAQQIIQDINNVQTQVTTVSQQNTQAMLSGYRRMLELQGLVFDTDGYFDPINIKPNSIEANMISVGARSQQLTLKDVIFKPNFNGNANSINITSGSLIHFNIDATGIKTWTLSAITQSSLSSSSSYYIYARVSRTGNTGTFVVATDQRKFDQEANFYNFLLGVLFLPQTVNGTSIRLIQLTYGSTFINGRTITTGRIISVDGLTWFDLDTGEFHGKFTFTDGTNVQTAVNNAQATANTAINAINDIGSDNKLTPSEKQTTILEWNRIKQEYTQNSTIANSLGISLTAYQTAYNTLNTYISPLLGDLGTTSNIDGSLFRNNFQNYYNQNIVIVQAIEDKKIQNIEIGGRNYLLNSTFVKGFDNWSVNSGNQTADAVNKQALLRLNAQIQGIFQGCPGSGTYTLSFETKAFFQDKTSALIGFNSNPQSFNIPGSVSIWTKSTIVINSATASDALIFYGKEAGRNEFYIRNIKLEKGNKATDWTPAPEDVDVAISSANTNSANALAQAQNALNTAAAVQQITSFLQTSISGNVVGTGTLLVGDVNGANAMICGVTDQPAGESIRFAAGKPYAQKYLSPYQVLDNGMVRFVNPLTGQKTFELGFNQNTGKVVFDIYNENGIKVASIGSQGIMFTGYIPESYTKRKFRKLTTTTFTLAAIRAEIVAGILQKYQTDFGPPGPVTPDTWRAYEIGLNINTEAYEYYEGRNFESADNAQYAGFYTTANKFGDKLPDGIYLKQQIVSGLYKPSENMYNIEYWTEAYLIQTGRIISGMEVYNSIVINSIPTRNTPFPQEDYEQ